MNRERKMENRDEVIGKIFENIYILRQKIASSMSLPLKHIPLTYSQWQVLNHVSKQKRISIKELAGLLDITSSAATQIVDGLVKKGFLVRERSCEDRRVQKITLSRKSFLQLEKSMKKICPIFEALDDQELSDYCRLTAKLAGK
jgi:DNA-binding MarR family transcriptional regulator